MKNDMCFFVFREGYAEGFREHGLMEIDGLDCCETE